MDRGLEGVKFLSHPSGGEYSGSSECHAGATTAGVGLFKNSDQY